MAGLPCTRVDRPLRRRGADATGRPPDLTLVYLPHLDYDPQRLGPDGCDWPKLVGELDEACAPLLDAARKVGARVWVVNEYGHVQVEQPVYLNRVLRQAGLAQRRGPGRSASSSTPSPAGRSRSAIISWRMSTSQRPRRRAARARAARRRCRASPASSPARSGRRSASIIRGRASWSLLAEPNAWFAYPFWLDDRQAPDYARTVDIHRKPGYDPCELFFDPKLWWPKGRAMRELARRRSSASAPCSTWCRSTPAWCGAATVLRPVIPRTVQSSLETVLPPHRAGCSS